MLEEVDNQSYWRNSSACLFSLWFLQSQLQTCDRRAKRRTHLDGVGMRFGSFFFGKRSFLIFGYLFSRFPASLKHRAERHLFGDVIYLRWICENRLCFREESEEYNDANRQFHASRGFFYSRIHLGRERIVETTCFSNIFRRVLARFQ